MDVKLIRVRYKGMKFEGYPSCEVTIPIRWIKFWNIVGECCTPIHFDPRNLVIHVNRSGRYKKVYEEMRWSRISTLRGIGTYQLNIPREWMKKCGFSDDYRNAICRLKSDGSMTIEQANEGRSESKWRVEKIV